MQAKSRYSITAITTRLAAVRGLLHAAILGNSRPIRYGNRCFARAPNAYG